MKDKLKHRFTIHKKITVFILMASFIVGFVGLGLVYWSEYILLRQTISRDYLTMGKLLGNAMDRIISREIESTQVFMSSSDRLFRVEEYNLKYVGMSDERKAAYFKDMDQRWMKAADNDSLIAQFTKSPVGIRLSEIARDDPSIAEIFMTDKYGGLVAASARTSDFYQADEEWWQKSFDQGKGSVFLDKIGLDPSSKTTAIAIVVPIKNKLKEVIGVCKNNLEIKRLFSPLKNFNIGKTGHVGLMDNQGYFIFHPGFQSMAQKFPEGIFKKIIRQNSGNLESFEVEQLHKKKVFISYFKVDHPEILKSGIEWWICITQDDDEVFAPLQKLIFDFILVALFMFVIILVIGYFFGAILVKPIVKLRDATQKVAKGNLDYKVEIKTHDEIEDLAGSFNSMLDGLKRTFTTIDKLNDEITLRKNAENILQKSETWFSTTLSSIGDAVITVDTDGLVTFINPVAQKLTGWLASEAIGKHIDKVFVIRKEDTDVKVDNPVLKVLSNGQIINLTNHTILISKDGQKCAIDDSAAPIRGVDNQEIMGVVLVFRDVTERNNAEKQLRELSVAVEQSPAGVVITDLKGDIQYVNPKFVQLTGYTLDEVKGKNPRVLKSGEQPVDFYKNLWDTINSGKEWRGEFHNKRKNGELYWEGASISPIRNREGTITNFMAAKEDITERKKMVEELKQKNIALEKLDQLKSDFVSIVSHELRTPLAITKEGISLVLDGITGDINSKQNKILTTSKNNIDRLARIINGLLDISKIESGRVELKKTPVNLVALIRNVVFFFVAKAKERGIELRAELPKDKEIILYVDEDRIIQVFTNLIGNALKFTEIGSVVVSLIEKEDQIEFIVSDTGVGIAPEDLPNVFNKFMQFGRVAGSGEKGTGLGLSIAKGLIELHRGQIRIESEVNRGTKFIFTLPRYSIDQIGRDQIEDAIANALRASAHCSLIVATLRYSGKINQEVFAEKLKEIKKVITNELHKGKDLVSRYGNEFFIILQDCNKNCALVAQGRIQQVLKSYFASVHLSEDLRIDFGLATYPDDANSYQELMNKIKQV